MPGSLPSSRQLKKNKADNENDNLRRYLVTFIFLILSFGCIFCSSQSALWFANERQVDASMLSARMVDYGNNLAIPAAPLNINGIATEVAYDQALLVQTPQTLGVGQIAMVPTPLPTFTATPVPPLPTFTFTPTPTSSSNSQSTPASSPVVLTPTSPPASPTVNLSTPTLSPPTPTLAAPTPTLPPPTPTLPPPTPTPPPPPPTPTPNPTSPPPSNNPPVAVDDSAVTDEEVPVVINVRSNDTDSDGTTIPSSVTVIGGPANGATVVNGGTGAVTYSPNVNFFGIDTFTYRICDDDGACDTATVTITVNPINDPPLAVDDSALTELVPITINVLGNDSDPDGDPLIVSALGSPSAGTVGMGPGNTVIYTPTITGTYTFTYTVSDGTLTDTAVVTVRIDNRPIAVDDIRNGVEDTPTVIDVLGNDNDPDGDPLTIISATSPANGTATINLGNITYQPNPDYHGDDIFTYTISDGLLTDTATVTVTTVNINDAPVAVNDSYTMSAGTLIVPAPGVLDNDSDVDGDPLTASVVTWPISGTLGFNPNGSFNYVQNTTGVYTFTYIARDTILTPSNLATVTITVN